MLKAATTLVKTHGFTRDALSQSVLHIRESSHTKPLQDTAISALFGPGDQARVALINAWLDEGVKSMNSFAATKSVQSALEARLRWNEPVLQHLPEVRGNRLGCCASTYVSQAHAMLASSTSRIIPINPEPGLRHAARVADEACYVAGDTSLQYAWYARRVSLAAIYSAAELHQFTSPDTAISFLHSLLDTSASLGKSVEDIGVFTQYVARSWVGIFKSKGLL